MPSTLAIGDFARATHMSVKTLRHYHRVGLLEPADVDPQTGYRRYVTDQIATAQVIRRFRDLEMPLDDIRAVLTAPDLATRNALIASHLSRLEAALEHTWNAVASLRDLLEHPTVTAPIEHRAVAATPAAAITEVLDSSDAQAWFQGALGELTAQGLTPCGTAGGVFDAALFTHERGRGTLYIPTKDDVRRVGRVASVVVPACELAIIEHPGPLADIDRAYGALATYVIDHALAVDGPIREYYLVGPADTPEEQLWRTEVGWPIFQTTSVAR